MAGRTSVAGTLAALALICGVSACGGGDEELVVPDDAVAVVGDREIARTDLERRVRVLRRGQRGGDGKRSRAQLRAQALTVLLQEAALEQEAAQAGLSVSDAEVRQRFRTARQRFSTRAAYERFLGNQTTADLLAQIRTQILAEKIADRDRAGDGASAPVASVQDRWADRTACRSGYSSPLCGR